MLKKKSLKYTLLLILIVLACSSCSTKANYNNCPRFPIGGEKVARELENMPFNGYENTWEWIGRLEKLKQELDLCK